MDDGRPAVLRAWFECESCGRIPKALGHASLNTTIVYARADLDLKRQALAQVVPDAPRPPHGWRFGCSNVGVVDWLRRI